MKESALPLEENKQVHIGELWALQMEDIIITIVAGSKFKTSFRSVMITN